MSVFKKLTLAMRIFIGLALGIGVGVCFIGNPEFTINWIKPFGILFLNLVKFIVVPIVLFSIISGIISMKDIRKVGFIGSRTILYYMLTTAFAVTIGLIFAYLFKPMYTVLSTTDLAYTVAESKSFIQVIVDIFPANIITPMADGNMLQVIVIALFFGIGIILAGEKGTHAANFCESFNEVSMKVMGFIIEFSPLGVFCLIAPVIAENGLSILGSLAMVLLTAYLCYILHAVVVYSLSVKVLGGISPITFFKGIFPAIIFAFSSASSVGTLPLNLSCVTKLGADIETSSFVLPLGATINMDGTAIYQGVCAMFIATCYGIDLTFGQMCTVVLTAVLASIGTAGVPGAGMIMLAMVLQSVGLPIEGIALVAGVDRIFDMGRTTVNITGDAACALVISKIKQKRYNNA